MALKNLFKFGRKKKKEDEIEKELKVAEERKKARKSKRVNWKISWTRKFRKVKER